MKILFVIGGSYKAFYINNLKKFKRLDYLVFKKDILYEFDYYNEFFKERTITNEMIILSKRLKCKIIAEVSTNLCGKIEDEILYCDENGVKILNKSRFLKNYYKNKTILFSQNYIRQRADLGIFLDDCRGEGGSINKKFLIFCGKNNLTRIKNGRICKKFRKICYFNLKF